MYGDFIDDLKCFHHFSQTLIAISIVLYQTLSVYYERNRHANVSILPSFVSDKSEKKLATAIFSTTTSTATCVLSLTLSFLVAYFRRGEEKAEKKCYSLFQ